MKPVKILLMIIAVWCNWNSVFAQTWVQTSAPSNLWSSVACSADGSKLVAVGGVSAYYSLLCPICISTNSGQTWIEGSVPTNIWGAVAISADGLKMVAAGGGLSNPTTFYTSTNGGISWLTTNLSVLNSCVSVASSGDGSKIYALSMVGGSFMSTNSGKDWTSFSIPGGADQIASSSDGAKLIAGGNCVGNGLLFTSTNSGMTWITHNTTLGYWLVASSADGSKLVAADWGSGLLCTSTNSGATWVSNNVPIQPWQQVAMSADGTRLIAVSWDGLADSTGAIYTSVDSGVTWISNNVPNEQWQGAAISADGSELIAVSAGIAPNPGTGRIWISHATPSPVMNIMPTNGSLALSWLVPSTNFVLQQSSDLISWSDMTNTLVLNLTNLQNQVSLLPTNSSDFYRLATP
jgi:hypothetical protein